MINLGTIEKFGKVLLKAGIVIGSMLVIMKTNDELNKIGVNIDANSKGGFDIHTENKSVSEKPKAYSTKGVTFNSNSITERSIAELYLSATKTYSISSKLDCAKRIYSIAVHGDDKTKLVAIQALARIADDTYSEQVKEYVNNSISILATNNTNQDI